MSFCRDYYRLELHWSGVSKIGDRVCSLTGAYFSGPALKIAKKINGNDSINIDVTPQYIKILASYYFINLQWKDVEYSGDKVLLKEAVLIGEYVNDVSNLEKQDTIIIDTQNHEEKVHVYNLVYKGQVLTKEGALK